MIEMLMAAALAVTPPALKDYLRDPIGLYDADGGLVRKTPKKDLPKPPFHVTPAGDFVSFDLNGKKTFLRNSDVLVEGQGTVCIAIAATAQSASRRTAASDIGVKSGMGDADVPCVQPH